MFVCSIPWGDLRMKIDAHSFEVFDRDNFIYRKGAEGSEKVKKDYVSAWHQWKNIVETGVEECGSTDLVVENTEHWQNSGSLRRRFWTRIKDSNYKSSPSCIAAMISKDNLRIYLEWHGYKNEKLIEERRQHNSWLDHVSDWIKEKNINIKEFKVWTDSDNDEAYEKYITLQDYLADQNKQESINEYLGRDNKHWVRVGKVFTKPIVLEHGNFTAEIGVAITELEWLYNKSVSAVAYKEDPNNNSNQKYWLFNVGYAIDPTVWQNSQQFEVAAMQYEYGRENNASVTRNINLLKKISVGDYIVAYSGKSGFLGYGKVTKPFFEETDPDKFIHATGAHWRQRVGVNWLKAMDNPIPYRGSNFTNDVGIIGNSVMGSSTIFEISYDGFSFTRSLIDGTLPIKIKENPRPLLTQKEVVNHIFTYIKSKGFNYSLEEVANLFLSIKTKPFVILSGISGTGKTKMVQWFAESVGATEENGQFTLIPIRPDWNDGSDLLGYVDIKGEFKPGPLTKVIGDAEENPDLPFFVLLDEMNLARVEHYFSDILSVMESRKWLEGKMITTTLLPKETAKRDIKLPTNLYILGTVNMDETTHPFSKKVLDRANTIEFNRVDLADLSFLSELEDIEPLDVSNNVFQSSYLHLKDLYKGNEEFVMRVTKELENINKILQQANAHFGYRVRDEISFYLYYNQNSDFLEENHAMDHCILQKILPRINGSDQRTEQLLKDLYLSFTGRVYSNQDENNRTDLKEGKYPKSSAKIVEMIRRLQEDGFTSFWVS